MQGRLGQTRNGCCLGYSGLDRPMKQHPQTRATMTSNQLTSEQRGMARMFGQPLFVAGHSYGMGVAVVMEPGDAMRKRLEEFSLSLHPDKTCLIEFGRHAADRRARAGLGKPETFQFLGFVFHLR